MLRNVNKYFNRRIVHFEIIESVNIWLEFQRKWVKNLDRSGKRVYI